LYEKRFYICEPINHKKIEIMENQTNSTLTSTNNLISRYSHYVIDMNDDMIEHHFSANNRFKISMQCLAKIKNGKYLICDNETFEIVNAPKI